MKASNIIITIIVVIIIIAAGAYFTGYFDAAPEPTPAVSTDAPATPATPATSN